MPFTARYDGTCPECQLDIVAGEDELTKYDDEYMHEHCAQRRQMETRRERNICPICHLTKPCECPPPDPRVVAFAQRAVTSATPTPEQSAARLAKMALARPAPPPVPTGAAAVDAFFEQADAAPPSYITLEEQEEAKVPRDRWDRPLITQPDGGREPYNRASSYGGQLEDKTNVQKWEVRQVIRGLAILQRQNPALLSALPEYLYDPWEDQQSKEKKLLDSFGDRAKEAAGSNLKSQLGTDIHYATELVDAGDDLEGKLSIFEPWRKDLLIERANAYYRYTQDLGLRWDSIETFGVQDDLKVAGTWDRRGYVPWWPEHRQVIGDVKTSSSMDYAGVGFSVQLATYAHMCEYVIATGERIPHQDMNEDWALIIHVDRNKGGPVEAFKVDIAWGWMAARYARGVILARRDGGKGRITRLDEREAQILTCTTRAELRDLAPLSATWPTWLREVARDRFNALPIEED